MKRISAILLSAILVGCAAPVATMSPYSSDAAGIGAKRADASELRTKIHALYEQRALASLPNEIDRLDKEIAALEARLVALESVSNVVEVQQTSAPVASPASGTYSPSSGPVYTGPRGGRYTITPSGKKSYIRRK